jgi:hypothetical protein
MLYVEHLPPRNLSEEAAQRYAQVSAASTSKRPGKAKRLALNHLKRT